jgi:hypothetical protein
MLAEGTKRIIPNAIISRAITILTRYPTFLISCPAGEPKIKNAEKMAAVTKYDCVTVRLSALCKKGVRNPLIPTPNPITKNNIPISKSGINKVLCLPDVLFVIVLSFKK